MRCGLDTVADTSPEFDELEAVVEACEPLGEADMTAQAPTVQGPDPVIFVSPEFDEIEAFM